MVARRRRFAALAPRRAHVGPFILAASENERLSREVLPAVWADALFVNALGLARLFGVVGSSC